MAFLLFCLLLLLQMSSFGANCSPSSSLPTLLPALLAPLLSWTICGHPEDFCLFPILSQSMDPVLLCQSASLCAQNLPVCLKLPLSITSLHISLLPWLPAPLSPPPLPTHLALIRNTKKMLITHALISNSFPQQVQKENPHSSSLLPLPPPPPQN